MRITNPAPTPAASTALETPKIDAADGHDDDEGSRGKASARALKRSLSGTAAPRGPAEGSCQAISVTVAMKQRRQEQPSGRMPAMKSLPDALLR